MGKALTPSRGIRVDPDVMDRIRATAIANQMTQSAVMRHYMSLGAVIADTVILEGRRRQKEEDIYE